MTPPSSSADTGPGILGRFGGGIVYYLPSVLVMLGLVLLWQVAVVSMGVKEYILPTPWAAVQKLSDPNYQWTSNFLATLYAVLGAFALSAVLGSLHACSGMPIASNGAGWRCPGKLSALRYFSIAI